MMKSPRTRAQKGQAMIFFALAMVLLFGLASVAVDQGVAQADRRNIQAASDAAALAGARQYALGGDVNAAHYVALQYLAANFSSTTPAGCTMSSCAAAGPWTMGNYTFNFSDDTLNQRLDVGASHSLAPSLAGILGVTRENVGTGARAKAPGPTFTGANYALAAVGGDAAVNGGGVKNAASGNVSGAVYVAGTSFGANNGPHAVKLPGVVSDGNGNACSGNPTNHVDFGTSSGNSGGGHYAFNPNTGTTNTSVGAPSGFATEQPVPPAGTIFTTASQAISSTTHHWQPGTYSGITPNNGLLDPGVYLIKNVANPDFTGAANAIAVSPGAVNNLGAVALVVDSTDSGSVTIANTNLNGFDDNYGKTYTGPATRDPQGTHNFVLFGATFPGNISSLGPGSTPAMTGIIYMPNSSLSSHGNVSYDFEGAVYIKDFSLAGGGNGTQTFSYICDLSAVVGTGTSGGLQR